ncbi:ornithine decarboxylase antizyme 1-like [Dermacentor silvarum]|uniref:ornithine decarboxylase antizyme 1-like n=1 Tax=Dermacentor silvarum TaxID=543639 RepID=UPI001898C05A|nr:ornithine decarboxylase antizyme 1-like [Dermacentor silvarum]
MGDVTFAEVLNGRSQKARGRCCATTVSLWVLGLCGVPDAPHAADVSLSSTGGSGVGSLKAPPVDNSHVRKGGELFSRQWSEEAVRLTFRCRLTEQTEVNWETVLCQGRLYVQLPSCVLPDGSREAFVTLLEFAEEQLGCTHVLVLFNKDRTDRAGIMRTFMFLGFTVLAPGHPLVPPSTSEGLLYMVYAIE